MRERVPHRHTHTEAARIQPSSSNTPCSAQKNSVSCCVRGYNSGTCVRVLHRPHVFLCLCVPTHDTGIVILGDDELQYRPTLAAPSKNKWWEFKTWDSGVANLRQLARIGGVLRDEIGAGVHFGGCAGGVNPRTPHAPCMAQMSRVHG